MFTFFPCFRALESAALVCRAEATLDKKLVPKFTTLRSLPQTEK